MRKLLKQHPVLMVQFRKHLNCNCVLLLSRREWAASVEDREETPLCWVDTVYLREERAKAPQSVTSAHV